MSLERERDTVVVLKEHAAHQSQQEEFLKEHIIKMSEKEKTNLFFPSLHSPPNSPNFPMQHSSHDRITFLEVDNNEQGIFRHEKKPRLTHRVS